MSPVRIEDKDSVRTFVDHLKQPDYLLEGCRRFCELERRDSVYATASDYAEKNNGDIPRLALAGEALLLTWNKPYYKGKRWKLIFQVNGDLQQAMRTNWSAISALRCAELGRLSDGDVISAGELFANMAGLSSIGSTGAAKALSLICPTVFVMWDTSIKGAYHTLHVKDQVHDIGTAACYLSFMATCNEVGSALLSTGQDLSKAHPSFRDFGTRKRLAKMIDECNYVRFFMGQIW